MRTKEFRLRDERAVNVLPRTASAELLCTGSEMRISEVERVGRAEEAATEKAVVVAGGSVDVAGGGDVGFVIEGVGWVAAISFFYFLGGF